MRKIALWVGLLAICLWLSACSSSQAAVETPEPTERSIFYSDATAIDFLEGYWTDGQGDFLNASRGDTVLILWSTNLPTAQCDLYVLREGVLTGGTAEADGSTTETEMLRFEKIDEDSIRVDNLLTGTSNIFVRDSYTVDTERLDNDYVFWSMDRAAPYLTGMWMDEGGDYFILAVDNSGSVSVNSNLDFPSCDKIDFCNGVLCAVTYNSDGTKNITELYSFDIQDRDNVIITSIEPDLSASFERLSDELDEQLLNSRYIFANAQRAFAFLEGIWRDGKGNYFTVETVSDNMRWNTNLSLPRHDSYTFALGGLVGTDTDEEGNVTTTMIFRFNIISEDEVEMYSIDSDRVYDLTRYS